MKCKLNPNLTDWLFKAFLWITLLPLAILIAIAVYYGTGIVGASILQLVDSDWLYQFLINDITVHSNPADFWRRVGNTLIWKPIAILALSAFALTIIAVAIHEIKESMYQRKHDLEYRFETNKIPWYRVLLSYVIVCEKTENINN